VTIEVNLDTVIFMIVSVLRIVNRHLGRMAVNKETNKQTVLKKCLTKLLHNSQTNIQIIPKTIYVKLKTKVS